MNGKIRPSILLNLAGLVFAVLALLVAGTGFFEGNAAALLSGLLYAVAAVCFLAALITHVRDWMDASRKDKRGRD